MQQPTHCRRGGWVYGISHSVGQLTQNAAHPLLFTRRSLAVSLATISSRTISIAGSFFPSVDDHRQRGAPDLSVGQRARHPAPADCAGSSFRPCPQCETVGGLPHDLPAWTPRPRAGGVVVHLPMQFPMGMVRLLLAMGTQRGAHL